MDHFMILNVIEQA